MINGTCWSAVCAALAVGAMTVGFAGDASAGGDKRNRIAKIQIGLDNNALDNPFVQPQDTALSGGGRDQTLQFGDVIEGSRRDDLQIGLLGTDVLLGNRGNDVLMGGIEHFNPINRDRAFGGPGNDYSMHAASRQARAACRMAGASPRSRRVTGAVSFISAPDHTNRQRSASPSSRAVASDVTTTAAPWSTLGNAFICLG